MGLVLFWIDSRICFFGFVTLDINAFQRKDIIFQEAQALFSICNT